VAECANGTRHRGVSERQGTAKATRRSEEATRRCEGASGRFRRAELALRGHLCPGVGVLDRCRGSGPALGSATRKQSGYLVLGQPVSVGVLKSRQRKGIGGMG
jgi:hypothetical protein